MQYIEGKSLDAILIVNAYHEMREHDAMLLAILRGLKPGGILGIMADGVRACRSNCGQFRMVARRFDLQRSSA